MNENLENNNLFIKDITTGSLSSEIQVNDLIVFRDDVCSLLNKQNEALNFLTIEVFFLNLIIFILLLVVFFKELLRK